MIRNTSPVGWVPLLAYKVLKEGSLLPFIISAVFVAIPIIFGCVWLDTWFYGSDTWVITGYNFLEMNVLHGLSKYFGEDDSFKYVYAGYPGIFTVMCIPALISMFTHIKFQIDRGQVPYTSYFTIFYLFFFSLIPHKEMRFLLPSLAFVMIATGELLH